MKQIKKLSLPIYNLLINNELNDFSVIQARDELQKSEYRFSDDNEARLYIYRQLHRLVANGLLQTEGEERDKKYRKTELFDQTRFAVKLVKKHIVHKSTSRTVPDVEVSKVSNKTDVLEKECTEIQANLSVSLAEVEEYRQLMLRFPETRELLSSVFHEEKERSVRLLAQLNTRNYLLNALKSEVDTSC
ncbi:hypothetical protein DI392_03715 [Vibrio albus]|uniref:Response regulator n=1 Tax=Vibrio albus TaxID=2200953 RepID=A0A2U3BBX1_9VIBR|nr:hypothetical protein [Vibrio albus]PWI34235.1 hypothetical protein DI392_03715 [Vibrio albus]